MKKKKLLLENDPSKTIFSDGKVKVSKNNSVFFFEIGKEMTQDLAEAVAIMMREVDFKNDIWNLEIQDVNIEDIIPEKSLFWLTGGYNEWRVLEHYNKPWCEAYLDFQEEFGFIIVNTIKRSKRLYEVRDNFIKYLNLPILYDFAVSKNLIR